MQPITTSPLHARNALRTLPIPANAPPHPNQVAQKLMGRSYLSWSSISTFLRCPIQFRYQYVEGRQPEFVSANLVFGSAIHSAIEFHYQQLFAGMKAPTLETLLDIYDQSWKKESGEIRFGKSESAASLRDLATRMLTAFQNHDLSKLDTSVSPLIGVEETLRGAIIPGVPDILGRIDLLVETPDTLQIVDFKTSRSSWSSTKVNEAAPQQLLYSKLVQPIADSLGKPIEIAWVVLTKTKQPKVEVHRLVPDPKHTRRIEAMVQRVWQAIQHQCFYANPTVMNCSTCSHFNTCNSEEETSP